MTTTLAFDGASRLTSVANDLGGSATVHDETQSFGYNPGSQVATMASSNPAYDWTIGANLTDAYTSNGLNQILAAGGLGHSYDGRGTSEPVRRKAKEPVRWTGSRRRRPRQRPTGVGAKLFSYDADNRLTGASGGGLPASTLAYDPAGRLSRTVAGATDTRFLYDGAEAIAEYDAAGAVLRRYVRGAGADEVLVWYEGAGVGTWTDAENGPPQPRAPSAAAASSMNGPWLGWRFGKRLCASSVAIL